MRLTVESTYPNSDRDVICRDENGMQHVVDFFVDGALPDTFQTCGDLIGKTIEVDYLQPHITIAANPRVLS